MTVSDGAFKDNGRGALALFASDDGCEVSMHNLRLSPGPTHPPGTAMYGRPGVAREKLT
jgi:hypothetical protein